MSDQIQSSQEENISPIMSQETFNLLNQMTNVNEENMSECFSEGKISDSEYENVMPEKSLKQIYLEETSQERTVPDLSIETCTQVPKIDVCCSENYVEIKPSVSSNEQPQIFFNNPGVYQFKIHFPDTKNPAKSAPWTFSNMLGTLFVGLNVQCPVQFSFQQEPPENCFIRATPFFKEAESLHRLVSRCLTHQKREDPVNIDFPHVDHIMRCDSESSEYHTNPLTNRLSVLVPFPKLDESLGIAILNYKFMCFTSCMGGMNRRPIVVVFTLEYREEIIAQYVVEVRICACPGRDRSKMENKKIKRMANPTSSHEPDPSSITTVTLAKLLEPEVSVDEERIPFKKRKVMTENEDNRVEISFSVRDRKTAQIIQRVLTAIKRACSNE